MLETELYKREPIVSTNSPLYPIYNKVLEGSRITDEDALKLFNSQNILEIGAIANIIREKYNKNKVYYVLNGHINYSNICTIKCNFCSFSEKLNSDKAYEMSLEDIKEKFNEFNQDAIREIHIVGGLHPKLPFQYYKDMIKAIKDINPDVCVKGFTAVEYHHFSKLYNKPVEDIFKELIDCGLGALPGGGAEIFDEKIRKEICPSKIDADQWLDIHRTAHKLGLKSNATMLFGHIESIEHRIDHLSRLRQLQDETGGFLALIPLTYHPEHNPLRGTRTSGLDEIKTTAISRIYLDNFPHIKAYWIMLGIKMAQMALNFGADDLDGTVLEEKITHAAGGKSPQLLSKKEIENLIRECHKVPVERDSFYNEIQR